MSDKAPKFPPYFKWAALAFFVTWAIILASALGLNIVSDSLDFERTGQFGDSFGVLNAIMASFAAISAFAAYQAQREELERLKNNEIENNYFAYKRDFESTFFNLLNLFRETVKEIDIKLEYDGDIFHGRDAISKILNALDKQYGSVIHERWVIIYDKYRDDLGHYFRIFYHIVRFIDESEIKNKLTYIRLLRATLSNAEIVLIGLNCIHGGGQEKLKPLVERYALLHNISSQFAEKWQLTTEFDASAFGDRKVLAGGRLGS